MRAFRCDRCGQLVFFENSACLRCRTELGFAPDRGDVVAVVPDADGTMRLLAGTAGAGGAAVAYRRCSNAGAAACNWLVAVDDPDGLCRSCRLTRTVPDRTDPDAPAAFAAAEAAKRRLVVQLLGLRLPVEPRRGDVGLAFDLLSSRGRKVVTGHDDGVITLDLAEADDPHREALRRLLGEPYRTLLGHFRHEIGHYYWPLLVRDDRTLEEFRALFGDERRDYDEAVAHHYDAGPPADWPQHHVSAYATMHPWENWAETFAHLLHISDVLETATAYGVRADPWEAVADAADPGGAGDPADASGPPPPAPVRPWEPIDAVVARWLPLTYALNAMNRSMGRDDLYPFVLAPVVVRKLGFVHDLVSAGSRTVAASRDHGNR